jgi:hypothetical protein
MGRTQKLPWLLISTTMCRNPGTLEGWGVNCKLLLNPGIGLREETATDCTITIVESEPWLQDLMFLGSQYLALSIGRRASRLIVVCFAGCRYDSVKLSDPTETRYAIPL